ncbi:hypothetical protein DFQ28_009129 [Apophysomyces sp. BC1034]|nr:hypothetical protein DFQ30_002584 [Apophysomyces sp. BC1015]KAG0173722.1 hypothetical protein DFQ29_007782 [Apophysomyces sp. BC1021]KAG0185576.1 hypothetical protein DFQ28_009129 [Apophysomyces sp. BC1034]
MSNHPPDTSHSASNNCLLENEETQLYQPQAEDILTDEDLLDLFRIVKQFLRKKPDQEKLAKLLFCISYALGDHVKFYKHVHEDKVVFRGNGAIATASVRTPMNSSCCPNDGTADQTKETNRSTWEGSSALSSSTSSTASSLTRLLSVSYLTNPSTNTTAAPGPPPLVTPQPQPQPQSHLAFSDDISTDAYTVRPYTNFRPLYPSASTAAELTRPRRQDSAEAVQYPRLDNNIFERSPSKRMHGETKVLMEPRQRGFYYQDGRIAREPALLQRYAEQGVLTQASLMRKRKRQTSDADFPYMLCTLPAPTKKPKIPHRHGEFEQRRDDIISRMRTITMSDLEQKSQRMSADFTIAIDYVSLPPERVYASEEAAELLKPALRTLTSLSNMKPHQDNGMNQNGIYYNTDYFRLYLAFDQFQKVFSKLFPTEAAKMHETCGEDLSENGGNMSVEKDKDRERNANMKTYRAWIEPLLTETNWAAFRRNIVVGERIFQLTKVVGQGILLMTKELSGSKLHLTFTNNEWEEFINGLESGKWDQTIQQDKDTEGNTGLSLLVSELRQKFATRYWFYPHGLVVTPNDRKSAQNEATAHTWC